MDTLLGFTQATPFSPPKPVMFDENERLRTHMLALGSPGSGKSKFLEYISRNDIANKRGICYVDYHGSTYNQLKKWCAYNYKTDDVVVLDPSNCQYVKGFN